MSLSFFIPAWLLSASFALAWSEPHHAITKGALEALPAAQRKLLGDEYQKLIDDYCLIPDHVYTDKANARYAAREDRPGEVYLQNLHLPALQPENLETLQYFVVRAVKALREGKTGDAARFIGTICHLIEDYGSPAHTVPGDNMFTLLQQFLPPSEAMKDHLLHSPIESGHIVVDIRGYQPHLLGTSIEEASWRLLHRINEEIINARSTTIPIIQALYAEDAKSVAAGQMKAATMDAQVLADALHTFFCLGTRQFEEKEKASLQSMSIASLFPLEAANLYFPQSQFFSSPYWGYPRVDVTLEGGNKAVPLKLNVNGTIQLCGHGISVGLGKPVTFPLPAGIYQRFKANAGLQAGLGSKGRVEFTVLGDGKPLASAIVNGTDPAHEFDCDISQIAELQLTATPKGLDPKSNYAVWGDPTLHKQR